VASGNLGCDIMYIEPLDDKTKQSLSTEESLHRSMKSGISQRKERQKSSSLREMESLFPSV
ncbi:MAG: hypothetical protein ACLRMV_08585, partial [Lachnospiraceae bacterium]